MGRYIDPEEWVRRLAKRGVKAFEAMFDEHDEIAKLKETNKEEWDAIGKRMSHCYELTHEFVSVNPEFFYACGVITNIFKPSCYTYKHAWAEKGDVVFDPVLGRYYTKEKYYLIFNPKKVKTYTLEEVMNNFYYYGSYWGWKERPKGPVEYDPAILTKEALECFFDGDRILADRVIREGFVHPKTIGKMLRRMRKCEKNSNRNDGQLEAHGR